MSPRSTVEQARADFVERVARILELPAYQRADAFGELLQQDEAFVALTEAIERYAAHTSERSADTKRLIDDILNTSADVPLSSGAGRAFDLLHALRVWDEHEVLAAHRFGVDLAHDPAMEELAQKVADAGWSRKGREDFTGWWTCTIDAADTLDVDDALSIRPRLEGGWELAVHIADPTAFIEPGTELDSYIQRRGTSIYLPTGAVPMIPRALSERALSLVASEERPAITTHIVFDENLDIVDTRIVESVVCVNARYTYAEADALLASDSNSFFVQTLTEMRYIADELHARRHDRGAIVIDLPEPRVRVEFEHGEPVVTVEVMRESPSRSIVSEMMVMVGECIARWCFERDVPVVYRTQEGSDVHRSDRAIAAVEAGWAREYAILRRMRRAEVSTRPSPHAALAVSMYAQATSPIRRYGDLANQRQFKAIAAGEEPPYDHQTLFAVVETVEKAAYEASAVEREAVQYWMLHYLQGFEGSTLEAVVLGYHDERRLQAEVMLVEVAWRTTMRLRKPAELGQTVEVFVDRARPRAGQLGLRQR